MAVCFDGERIKLRALEPEDLEDLYRWENDTSIWNEGSSLVPYSKFVIRQYIAGQSDDIYSTKQLRLMVVLKENNQSIGTVDLYDFDPQNLRAGIGLLIDEAWRNLGYGTEALSLMCEYAFGCLNLRQLYAVVRETNVSSDSVFCKCNFTVCANLRSWVRVGQEWYDCLMYQKMNNK